MGTQGNHAGAGQGRDVDDRLRLEALGVGQGVAQHQAAFGVGVEDFHGLAAHGGDDVARARSVAARHVLGAGQDAHQVDRQLQFEHGTQGAEHAGGAAHVVLHFIHAGTRLEADAAGVEGDAFADQRVRLLGFLATVVLHDDQARRLGAALADGVERAHAQSLDLLLVEDFDFQVLEFLAQVFGLLTEEGRVTDVRRQVTQVAGEGHAVGDGGGVGHGALHFSLGGLDGQQGDFLQGAGFGFLALELLEAVLAVHQGFGQQAGLAIAVAALDHDFVEGQYRVAAAQALQGVEDAGNDFAERAVTQFVVLASAHQQHTLGLEVRQAVQQQALANLAGQVAALEHCADRAAAQFVELSGNGAELAAFADGDHESGGLQRFGVDAFYNQFHVRVPELMVITHAPDTLCASIAYK
ncbi:hypothetical protein D3C78_536340 [compost metagenome]